MHLLKIFLNICNVMHYHFIHNMKKMQNYFYIMVNVFKDIPVGNNFKINCIKTTAYDEAALH